MDAMATGLMTDVVVDGVDAVMNRMVATAALVTKIVPTLVVIVMMDPASTATPHLAGMTATEDVEIAETVVVVVAMITTSGAPHVLVNLQATRLSRVVQKTTVAGDRTMIVLLVAKKDTLVVRFQG